MKFFHFFANFYIYPYKTKKKLSEDSLDITNRIEESQSNNFTIIIEKTQYKMALALLDVIALKIDDTAKRKIYKLNSIKFNVTTEVKDNKEVYNLKKYKIKYYLIENERIPGLIKRNK